MPAAPPLLGSTGSTTFVLAALLVALGLVMIGAAVWLVKATKTDVPALGPLEIVGDRRFARRDAEAQAAALAAVRPDGALGPAPMVEIEEVEPARVEPAAEPVGPAEPVEPVDQPEPVEAVEEAEPVEAVETAEPVEAVDAVDAVEPAVEATADGGVGADEPVAPVAEATPGETAESFEDLEAVDDDAEANERAEAAPQSS